MARSGMSDLISQFRSGVGETGTAIFSDDRIQTLLEHTKLEINQEPLLAISSWLNGTTLFLQYQSAFRYLEGTASGTAISRIVNFGGTVVTDFSSDFNNGLFTFTSTQSGSARYLTSRSYDLNKAIAEGWKEKAGYYATSFDFRLEGRQYSKSQIITHCMSMAKQFEERANPYQISFFRGDFKC